jgi:hypothetical protein
LSFKTAAKNGVFSTFSHGLTTSNYRLVKIFLQALWSFADDAKQIIWENIDAHAGGGGEGGVEGVMVRKIWSQNAMN